MEVLNAEAGTAQSAALALKDADPLARGLSEDLESAAALALFQSARQEPTAFPVEAVNRIGRRFHGAGGRDIPANLNGGASSLEAVDTWLCNHKPVTVPLDAPPATLEVSPCPVS